jgi:hypothetical protein
MHLPMLGSLDSFVAAIALAVAGCPKQWQRRLVAGFAICDMLAGWAGSVLGSASRMAEFVVIPAIAATAFILIRARRFNIFYLFVPFLLSFDNLALGADTVGSSFWSAAISFGMDGLLSGFLAVCGFAMVPLVVRFAQIAFVPKEKIDAYASFDSLL